MDYDLLQRAIAKQNGQPYGVGLGGQQLQPPVDPMALMASPNVPPAAEQAVAEQVALPPAPPPAVAAEPVMAPQQPMPAQPAPMAPHEELDALAQQQAESALRAGEAEGIAAGEKARVGAEHLKQADAIASKYESRMDAADAMYQQAMGDFRKLNDEAANLPPITGRTGAQKTWGAMAMLGASISDVYTGGNASVQVKGMLDQAAQRNIELQLANADKKRKDAASKFTEVGIARQYLGDTKEATDFALGLRKERLATAMEVEANKLTSVTAREKAQQVAAQYKVEAKKEQLDVLKALLAGRMSAVDIAMLKKMGVLPPGLVGGAPGDGARGPAASSSVTGPLTKAQQGTVNIAAHQASVGPWRAKDPSKADPVQTRKVQDYYAQNRIYTNALKELENLYQDSMDVHMPEDERRLAVTQFGIKRDEAIAKLSQKDDQGVVTNPEFARKIEALKAPPQNVVEKGMRYVKESWDGTISGPQVFQAMRASADRELDVMMESRDWTREAAPAAAAHEEKRKAPAGAKPKAPAGKPKRLTAEDL